MSTPAQKLQAQLDQVNPIRGRGPISYDYGRWVDATHSLLALVFGAESPEAQGFLDIVGEGAEARGWGLPLAPDNQWGMQQRLNRAEAYLESLLGQLVPGSS
ncbi:MAG TPA: hypothetical protein VMR52_09935 [Dehalococcoidia bacterium]|nr:hypothetical protein [Dehalococcoidia bacterium]